ncbi:diguanylate cyclase [Evansella sp. AB-rgal1]|uniref:histidine kinase N-terminal 7TM domain-containing diguanylate cyclase n=1 Tax=Evansella sp. AB-rgal1 TaxID=3242696 RepID=UPI00359EA259
MDSELLAYITLISTSCVLNLYLCSYVYLKRHQYSNIATIFVCYTFSVAIYCFASAVYFLSTTIEEMKLWTTIMYIGMPFSSPLGLLFIIEYLGVKIKRLTFFSLLVIPFISLVLVATNDLHQLFYQVYEIDPLLGAPFVHLEIGLWYVVHGIFTFGCMFVAFLLVLSRWRETAKEYRPQLIALMFGQFLPIVTAFVYLIGLTPQGIDPVPMILWISSLLYVWSISSSRLFRLMPIAKDMIFHSINDGVIVLDDSHRLIEFNHASKRMFPLLTKSMYGVNFVTIWFELTGEIFPSEKKSAKFSNEIEVIIKGSKRTYQIRRSILGHTQNRKGHLLIFTDITEIKLLQVKLEYQAYYDELTKINNRRAFFEKSELLLAEAKKERTPFTVILIDIDYFKQVNDTYGHHVGDDVLKHVVKVLQTQLKEDDLFARYGGEEFVVALKKDAVTEGQDFANQLRKSIESEPLQSDEGFISISISSGIAEATYEMEETLYQLLNKADKALYSAKNAGRNQVSMWEG